jgi:hypothetical protein
MPDKPPSVQDFKKPLEVLVAGQRRNQVYYLAAGVVSVTVALALILWSGSHTSGPGTAKVLVSGLIPILSTGLSVTNIVAAESKIATYRAAAALRGPSVQIVIDLIHDELVRKKTRSRGNERGPGQDRGQDV